MRLLIFSLLLFFVLKVCSQSKYNLIVDEQGIKIFSKEIVCNDEQNGVKQSFYVLQFVNTTDYSVHITWNIDYWLNGVCVTCDKPKTSENTYYMYLMPGEYYEPDCNKNSLKGTKIYINEVYNSKSLYLTNFEIVNLKIKIN